MHSNLDVIHAYRQLYRGILQAVQFSSPARYIARDQLRRAFREQKQSAGSNSHTLWDAEGVKRTIWFFQAAAKEKAIEHKILKNLLRIKSAEEKETKHWKKNLIESNKKAVNSLKSEQYAARRHYAMTVAMLNESMGLCLR